jgi:hypothetical protein
VSNVDIPETSQPIDILAAISVSQHYPMAFNPYMRLGMVLWVMERVY